jgi:hypothetical protein
MSAGELDDLIGDQGSIACPVRVMLSEWKDEQILGAAS